MYYVLEAFMLMPR